MSLAVSSNRKPRLTKDEQMALNRFLGLPEKKQVRLMELVRLYQTASDEEEQQEIKCVMGEVLFRGQSAVKASPVGDDVTPDEKRKLQSHRNYVAQQIKKQRSKAGLTQVELAKKTGLPQTHICRLELGQHAPTYKTIERIAKVLGVDPGVLDPSFD